MPIKQRQDATQLGEDFTSLLLSRSVLIKRLNKELIDQHKSDADFICRIATQSVATEPGGQHIGSFQPGERGTLTQEDLVGEFVGEGREVVPRDSSQPSGSVSEVDWEVDVHVLDERVIERVLDIVNAAFEPAVGF